MHGSRFVSHAWKLREKGEEKDKVVVSHTLQGNQLVIQLLLFFSNVLFRLSILCLKERPILVVICI